MTKARIFVEIEGMQVEIYLEDNSDYGLRSQIDSILDWKKKREVSEVKEVPRAQSVIADEDVPF